jgi:general secretion pathway protein E
MQLLINRIEQGSDEGQNRTASNLNLLYFIDFLVDAGFVDATGAQRAQGAMASAGQPIDVVLLELGLLPEQDLATAQARYLGSTVVGPEQYPEVAVGEHLMAPSFLKNSGLIPLTLSEGEITVAAALPLDSEPVRALGYYLDRKVTLRVARRSEWEQAFRRLYEAEKGNGLVALESSEALHERDIERLKDSAREAPVIRFVSALISDAVHRRASDIHVEPLADKLQIRLRVDGVLVTTQVVDKTLHAGVTSRIKVLARLNIAERRLPQDGRIALPVRGREIDFRVSTVPTLHGESVVLRVLDRQGVQLDFNSLGFDAQAAAQLSAAINQPNGIVLVSGPTGSGKTTTLYAAICELRGKQRKILTIEDPVEYHLDQVIQTQVKPQIGLDFATGLRAFLRQDPDVIMVGEIRDGETARTAVQASLTGHLVLSTLHTNSAAASISRLVNMGVENYLLVSTVRAILAQRLVRRLCSKCRRVKNDSQAWLQRLGRDERGKDGIIYEAGGCQNCGASGYQGRTTIYEIMPITPRLQELILTGAADSKLEETAMQGGMRTLLQTGTAKAMAGETSLEEVLRVTAGVFA